MCKCEKIVLTVILHQAKYTVCTISEAYMLLLFVRKYAFNMHVLKCTNAGKTAVFIQVLIVTLSRQGCWNQNFKATYLCH